MRTLLSRFFLATALSFSATLHAVETPVAPVALTSEKLLAALTRDLAAHFNFEGDLQLELQRSTALPVTRALVWNVNVLEYPAQASPSMLVRCRLLADATAVSEITLVLRASLWRDVWVARQPLVVGSTFDPATLDTRRVDFLRERDVLPVIAGDASFIFTRAVQSGNLLSWRDIARRPLVRKGDLVEVSAGEGMLLITMKALAMNNGARGDTVTLRNPESRRDFSATVVDENRVQVRF